MNTTNVDKAWENLYNRLNREDLIPPKKRISKNLQLFRWSAAAILFIGFVGTAIYTTLSPSKETNELLSKTNNEADNTLVTTLEDGSTVYLSGHSSLFYPENFASNERKVKMEGNILFDIRSELERPFRIETEHVSVKVTGTAFRIIAGKEDTFELFVIQGTVEVTDRYNLKPIVVEAGEMVGLESTRLYKRKYNNSEMFMAFTQKMHFKNERLDHILKVIENATGVTIFLTDKALEERILTVAFDNNTVASMLELICIALNLEQIPKQDGIYISPL